MGKAKFGHVGRVVYQNRGDVDTWDFIRRDLVADDGWQELDLSSIVPTEGANQLVHLKVVVEAQIAEKKIIFANLGQIDELNVGKLSTQAPDVSRTIDIWIKMDENRKIRYKMDNEGAMIPSLYARWRLDESSGNVAPDDSGNERNGVLIKMEDGDWVAGQVNNCLNFDGLNEYINCGDIANFERDEAFSIGCWFKTGIVTTERTLFAKFDASGWMGYWVYFNEWRELGFIISSDGGSIITVLSETFDDDEWHYLLFTYDGSSTASGIKVYIDDILKTLTVFQDDMILGSMQTTVPFQIAARDGSMNFKGLLDEVAIYGSEMPNPNDAWLMANLLVRGWDEQIQ